MKPARKRSIVDKVKSDWKVSTRRACAALKIDRSLYVYKSKRGEQAELKLRIKDICQTRVRYGYRRVHVLLKRDGWPVNQKRIYRLYKEMDLQLRNKVPKRRVKAKLRSDRTEATRSNHVWAMDFVHDQLATGRKIRVLTGAETFNLTTTVTDAAGNTSTASNAVTGKINTTVPNAPVITATSSLFLAQATSIFIQNSAALAGNTAPTSNISFQPLQQSSQMIASGT